MGGKDTMPAMPLVTVAGLDTPDVVDESLRNPLPRLSRTRRHSRSMVPLSWSFPTIPRQTWRELKSLTASMNCALAGAKN